MAGMMKPGMKPGMGMAGMMKPPHMGMMKPGMMMGMKPHMGMMKPGMMMGMKPGMMKMKMKPHMGMMKPHMKMMKMKMKPAMRMKGMKYAKMTAAVARENAVAAAAAAAAGTTAAAAKCIPRPGDESQTPYCTRAPTDFEKTTCKNAGGTLTSRDMYGQQFSYCVFEDGTSCQVEDIASGWCGRRSTAAPTTAPSAKPRMYMKRHPNNGNGFPQLPQQNGGGGSRGIAGLLPSLFGRANSDPAGASADGSSLGYAEVGDGSEMPDPTKFFGDQTGIANTGATAALAAGLAAAAQEAAYDGGGAPPVPQPVPLLPPPAGTDQLPPATPSPTSDALMSLLAQTTVPPAAPRPPFLRIGNPMLWLAAGLLLGLVFYLYRKYGRKNDALASPLPPVAY
jgi:hypothetical protein